MVLYELVTHHVPFRGYESIPAASFVALEDKRPPLPPGTPRTLHELICRAWSTRREARPSAAELVAELAEMMAELSPEEASWLDAPGGHPVHSESPGRGKTPPPDALPEAEVAAQAGCVSDPPSLSGSFKRVASRSSAPVAAPVAAAPPPAAGEAASSKLRSWADGLVGRLFNSRPPSRNSSADSVGCSSTAAVRETMEGSPRAGGAFF